MARWEPATTRSAGGYHRIVATPPGHGPMDITWVRGVPTGLPSYSTADPFGDATSQLVLPGLGGYDDPTSPDLAFLTEDTGIDIWWIPAMAIPGGWDTGANADAATWINPISGASDIIAPAWESEPGGFPGWFPAPVKRGSKVWEGHVASVEIDEEETSHSVTLSLQGALFQADLTLAKPAYPARPQTLESLILNVFDHERNQSLRTHRARIKWPDTWSLVAPSFAHTDSVFKPNVRPGAKWTGYTTRITGSWDHALTSFVQGLLSVMLVKPNSGVRVGSQWTLMNALEGDPDYPAGRTPVLRVRDRFAAPTFAMWVGTPGLKLELTSDGTQAENVLYGTGTDLAGTTWRNAVIADDGSRTDYRPLAWSRRAWPPQRNPGLRPDRFLRESYVQYGAGFSQVDATVSAAITLERDLDPGWSGTVTLRSDPSAGLSRWAVRAGMTLHLKGFRGTGATGMHFHIAGTEANPADGSVTLTVDTRYRDLLTLNEAIARTRDALTPAKLLQLNRNSVTIEDIQAPWDYSLGSGFVPRPSRLFYAHKPESERYPYLDWIAAHPPREHPAWYVTCNAGSSHSQKRWSGPHRILMAEKGTIRRTEIFCVNRDGHLVRDKFHFSLWYSNGVNAAAMPNNGKVWSPFIKGAFESIDPSTGGPWPIPGTYAPNEGAGLVIGWGNYAQPAGYSPGLETQGAKPTGLLVDESSWSWDCSTNNNNYDPLAKAGRENKNVISLYAMFYSEHPNTVYFGGRLFRQEPGTDA